MWIVLGVILLLIAGLVTDKIRPHVLFLMSALFLMVIGILTPKNFLQSFANESIATIFVLILLTAAINNNFNLLKHLDSFFIQKRKPKLFLFQMTTSVGLMSSLMNNTPIVALLIPYVMRWSKKMQVSPSKLLIPLSYAAIIGGMITLIGTSTNLVLNGFIENEGGKPFGVFDFLIPGLLVTGVGVLFLSVFGYSILKNRVNPLDTVKSNLKEYLVEVALAKDSAKIGQTVEQAGLRNLHGIYLVEILRGNEIISPVSPDEKLHAKDRLYFAGDTSDILEIVKENSGFVFPKTEKFNLGEQLKIIETLIPYNSNLSGKTLKESNFRERYDAAVIAIHRGGEKLNGKLGEINLEYGDLLLLTAGEKFQERIQNDSNLYAIEVKDYLGAIPKWKKQVLALCSLLTIIGMLTGYLSLFVGVLIILSAFFALGLFTKEAIYKNLNLDLFLILGSAIAIGSAFIETGAAKFIADEVIHIFSLYGNTSVIIGIFLLTVLLTAFVTNAAAISIVFPIAYEMSLELTIPSTAIFLAIAFGASCSFITPYSYQTNLMVFGPGGYKQKDFFRIGLPMTLLYSATCLLYLLIHYQIL